MPSTVALVSCDTYEDEAVLEAVARGLDLIGGARAFVSEGESVLLKPNLLVPASPESCVTTHPAVFSAVARVLADAGATLTYGDSPAVGSCAAAARKAGISQAAERHGVTMADFANGVDVSAPDGRVVKRWHIANGAHEADAIVSLAKMKTHALCRMTGAVKNQFGCVPGMRKGEFHARMPDVRTFAEMLVDLTVALAPRLYVMDGVIAMEGNGPRGGDPRPMGVVLLSADPIALDAVACRLMALDPELVETLAAGERAGLGVWREADIEVVGDAVDSFVAEDFAVNRRHGSTTGRPGSALFRRVMRDLIVPRPVIVPEHCTACGTCVRVCPVDPKAVDWACPGAETAGKPPLYDYAVCIRCYCCQEMCPERAIQVEVPPLGRLIHRERSR